jgi:hypothetical protein
VTILEGSRSDFVLEQSSGTKRIIEVKTVVDTDYCATWTLPNRDKGIVTSIEEPYRRRGIFPWGQSKQKGPDGEKVVSARAIKHLRELTKLVKGGEYDATVYFVVVRHDAVVCKFSSNELDGVIVTNQRGSASMIQSESVHSQFFCVKWL